MELSGEDVDERSDSERKMIRRPTLADGDKWNVLPKVPKHTEMGYLHLSFEYHKGVLKVRVWQISDLLLPPPQLSMIHSIFVRGYFMPDKVHKTQRQTEEVTVDNSAGSSETPKMGIQHIFTASSFKFQNPLVYTGVTEAIVKERSLQLEVCMTQKQSRRTFLMAMVHMPLRTAVRRPIREKYPLIPCLNITIPNNMRVYSAAELQLGSSKGHASPVNGKFAILTGKDVDLEDVVSLSGEDFLRSHLALCLDEDDEDDDVSRAASGRLRDMKGDNDIDSGGSSNTTLNILSSDEEDGESEDKDNTRSSPADTGLVNRTTVASKKKIIPNELLQTISTDNVMEDVIEKKMIMEKYVSPLSSSQQESFLPNSNSECKIFNAVVKNTVPTAEWNSKLNSPESVAQQTNRKSANDFEKKKNDSSDPPRRKKIMVLPREIIMTDASASASTHNYMDSEDPSPHNQTSSELSPSQDLNFTPTSRPETPCWDFYDFNEDLQPEDLEASRQEVENSLALMRQQGIGSLQNLSKEPILPMILVDDFDSLADDAEQMGDSE